jgi:hypothetical protein
MVFQAFYFSAFKDVQAVLFPYGGLFVQLQRKIKTIFIHQVLTNTENSICSSRAHQAMLSRFTEWKGIYSNTTCLSCIARAPENTLSCRHSLCDPCTIIYGQEGYNEPWKFILKKCPLCSTPNSAIFTLKPYIARTRCLVFEGGTAQDIVSLKIIEKELKLPMPIREHFDIRNGSGLGLLISEDSTVYLTCC